MAVGDVEREVLLHFVFVDHGRDRGPGRGGIVLSGPSGDRIGNVLELTLC
jgi:hypothetical protein